VWPLMRRGRSGRLPVRLDVRWRSHITSNSDGCRPTALTEIAIRLDRDGDDAHRTCGEGVLARVVSFDRVSTSRGPLHHRQPGWASSSGLRGLRIVVFLLLRPDGRPFVERTEGVTEFCPQPSELVAIGRRGDDPARC
jgi:hypothetical protein